MKTTLEETIRVSIPPFHLVRIRRIDQEDFAPVVKKMRKDAAAAGISLSDEYLDRGILALKQYYAIALLDPNNSHAVSDTVDPFWHTHLLFSQRYHAFCEDVVGVYMHHVPLDHDSANQVDNVDALYAYTRRTMSRLFSIVDGDFWPGELPRARLICMHRGNQSVYGEDVYRHALLPADPQGVNYAFA